MRKSDEFALRVEDPREQLTATELLQRIEIETDDVCLGHESWVHAATRR